MTELQKREPDSAQFIRPQRQWADLVVNFYPPHESDLANSLLNVRLVLRPTISHPDLSDVLLPDDGVPPAIRLNLDRDMGKPVDVLEVDSHATYENIRRLEQIICDDMPDLHRVCDRDANSTLGAITGTTGETLQSYPLALTQLLITHYMLKATQAHQ